MKVGYLWRFDGILFSLIMIILYMYLQMLVSFVESDDGIECINSI